MLRKTTFWAWAAFGWAAIIMVVSVIPGEDLPSVSIWEADKVFHALVYALLTFFSWQYLRKKYPDFNRQKNLLKVAGLCILYGFFIELIQLALPTRSFDLYDALANSIGCLISFSILLLAGMSTKKQ